MKNAEEDVIRLTSGKDTEDMYYKTITGLNQALSMSSEKELNQHKGNLLPADDPTEHSDSEYETNTSADEGEDKLSETEEDGSFSDETQTVGDKKAARKENKKKVKEEKREARKTKVPKAVKKKKKKLAKAKKYR